MQLLLKYVKPTCQNYHERKFDGYNFNWKLIYKLPRVATYDAQILIFQGKYYYHLSFFFALIFTFKCFILSLLYKTFLYVF